MVGVDKDDKFIFFKGGWFGNKKINPYDKPVLLTNKAYRFTRLLKRGSKYDEFPFYINDNSDNSPPTNITIEGDGSYDDGIINTESFILKFKDTYD